MEKENSTAQLVIEMMNLPFIQALDGRQRHLYQESLCNLVRLAKSEQLLEIRNSARRLSANAVPLSAKEEG